MSSQEYTSEPIIAVGLVQAVEALAVKLEGDFQTPDGQRLPAGAYRAERIGGRIRLQGPAGTGTDQEALRFAPVDPERGRFQLEATIGIDFHWQQTETQTFPGGLLLRSVGPDRLTAVNAVGLETYLTSVISSEMNAASPPALARAHAIISRSWLLAQLQARDAGGAPQDDTVRDGELRTWTDRQAHADFDVCADDHCQRYQGEGRVRSQTAVDAVADTRGLVLSHAGRPCDARFSKCCGGVSEDFRAAWGDEPIPYLVPVYDGDRADLPAPPLTDEVALRAFIQRPPEVYCNCSDDAVLSRVLNDYDRQTKNFFRWRVALDADEAGELIATKLGVDLGRITGMRPLARGLSGRLVRLELTGERGRLIVGKELAIRRALSDTHLYSSAFVVDEEGPAERPDRFVLTGAGWGHGVGLCQIGAAVMACQGHDHEAILAHYYPGTSLEKLYP